MIDAAVSLPPALAAADAPSELPVAIDAGAGRPLIGMLTPAQGSTACLLYNAGVIHRSGPRRINVQLARRLAAQGIPTLRFDLSGLGDSPAAPAPLAYVEQAVADLRTAMDWFERHHGIRRFVLFGICSGAEQAFWAALADARIVGILMFDGYWYRTRWTEPVRLWKRFAALGLPGLRDALERRLLRRRGGSGGPGGVPRAVASGSESANPPKAEFARHLQTLVDRGVAVGLLYGGSVSYYVSYPGQFADAFRGHAFVGRVSCELHPDIDHTVVSQRAQARLCDVVCSWARDAVQPGR